jgi:hypothetical protein
VCALPSEASSVVHVCDRHEKVDSSGLESVDTLPFSHLLGSTNPIRLLPSLVQIRRVGLVDLTANLERFDGG